MLEVMRNQFQDLSKKAEKLVSQKVMSRSAKRTVEDKKILDFVNTAVNYMFIK